jgi:hypothetical protein
MRLFLATLLFTAAQIAAWFQSNSGILGGKLQENYILVSLILGPIVSLCFAVATKLLYAEINSLWSIRFITFGIGYLVFIPLTWYFLGEEIITTKNAISFLLCVGLLLVQALMK